MEKVTWGAVAEELDRILCAPEERRHALARQLPSVLRDEVLALLDALSESGAFLEPALCIADGDRFGPYQVIAEIGRGGMGAVFRARRADGEFTREVALKVVAGRLVAPEAERRFIQERQILAQLDHPNIVRLLDGGIAGGLRYLAMELVEGRPIIDYASHAALTLPARVDLFIQLCAAIHYAHQHLIVHRDLKPANVLVTSEGVAKVLDFGIARILHGDADQVTGPNPTATALHPMSLACASPEQVRELPLTLATDIFSLGVLLYELLTGRNPHHQPGASAHETARRIVEDDPLRPRQIDSSIPKDLEAIVLKALSKDVKGRYASVSEFKADLDRFRQGQAVLAVPPRAGYVLRKFVRRNRVLTALTAVFLVVLGVAAVILWRQQQVEERRLESSRRLIRSVIFDMEPKLLALPGQLPLRRQLLKGTIEYLDAAAKDAGDNVALLRETIEANILLAEVLARPLSVNLGEDDAARRALETAESLLRRAREIAPAAADLDREESRLYRGMSDREGMRLELPKALEHGERAVAAAERLVKTDPSPANRLLLGLALTQLGFVIDRNDEERARPVYLRAEQIMAAAYAENPQLGGRGWDYVRLLGWMAGNARAHGDIAKQLEYARRGAQLADPLLAADPGSVTGRMATAGAYSIFSGASMNNQDGRNGLSAARRSVELRESVLADEPGNPQVLERLGEALRTLAQAYINDEDVEGARRTTARALQVYAELDRVQSQPIVGFSSVPKGDVYLLRARIAQYDRNPAERCRNALLAIAIYDAALAKTPGRNALQRVREAAELHARVCPADEAVPLRRDLK